MIGGPIVLVIFDCDGVLVDSEPLAMRALLETIAEAGLKIDTEEAYERFLGRSLAAISEILEQEFGVDLTHSALDRMRARLYEMFRSELKPIDGIERALDRLKLPYCVASSSQVERIRLALQVTGLLHRFEPYVFSASMVARGKPAPDLFLHAAHSMRADPAHCLVIEDSPAGVEAAKRAGMQVCAFTGGSHAKSHPLRSALETLRPAAVFSDMQQLSDFLEYSGTNVKAS